MELIFLFIIGTVIGSFSSLVIQRRISGESIVYPNSHCDTCKKELKPYDMIPIISFLYLRGKCRYCKSKIPVRNLLMEIFSGVLLLILGINGLSSREIILFLAIILALVIAVIDLKTFDIYMGQIGLLVGLGIIYRFSYLSFDFKFLLICLIFCLGYFLIYKISKGGLGNGDIYYYLSLFLYLPNHQIKWLILFSIWIGAIYGIYIGLKNKSRKIAIPFCIFIFLGFIIVIFMDRNLL